MFSQLPYFIRLKGKKYKINVDFRHIIKIEEKIMDRSADKLETICWCLEHFYPFFYGRSSLILRDKELFNEAWDKLVWFYKCGKEDYHKGRSGGTPQNRLFNYKYDDEFIYGAFYEKYRIDLTKDKIHWWKFKALLKSLHKTKFNEIQSYRSYKGDDKDMKDLRQYWELPIPEKEQKRLDELYEKLK